MNHQLFFYMTFSYTIGFICLTVLTLAYWKSGWKTLIYFIGFLLAGTFQLMFLTYVEYRYANIPVWFNVYYGLVNYGLESLNIIVLPLLVNELFHSDFRHYANNIFGGLFITGLICVVSPFLLGALKDGTLIETLISFKIYRFIYIIAYLYSFFVFTFKINQVGDVKEKKFYIYASVILLFMASQTITPIIKTFTWHLFVFATGYFYLNILLLTYTADRYLRFPKPAIQESFDGIVTSREKEILALLIQGLANKDIGARLCISEPTVKSHVQNIYKKIGVKNRIQLVTTYKNKFE